MNDNIGFEMEFGGQLSNGMDNLHHRQELFRQQQQQQRQQYQRLHQRQQPMMLHPPNSFGGAPDVAGFHNGTLLPTPTNGPFDNDHHQQQFANALHPVQQNLYNSSNLSQQQQLQPQHLQLQQQQQQQHFLMNASLLSPSINSNVFPSNYQTPTASQMGRFGLSASPTPINPFHQHHQPSKHVPAAVQLPLPTSPAQYPLFGAHGLSFTNNAKSSLLPSSHHSWPYPGPLSMHKPPVDPPPSASISPRQEDEEKQEQQQRLCDQQQQKEIIADSDNGGDGGGGGDDSWLQKLEIPCKDLSVEPFTGRQVLDRVQRKTHQVTSHYLPCVEFLVTCQQELRAAIHKPPRKFFQQCLKPLANRFRRQNQGLLHDDGTDHSNKGDNGSKALQSAVDEIVQLVLRAKDVQFQGSDTMKTTFLGGMKDGESWGLRKWLSKHGAALGICNDLECLLRSCQALDRSLDTTRRLGDLLRPPAQAALRILKEQVPASYQEISSAHPYLPFFHRLEAALKGMAGFDPEDDDVILVEDDEEIEEAKKKAAEKKLADEKAKDSDDNGDYFDDKNNNINDNISNKGPKRHRSQILMPPPPKKARTGFTNRDGHYQAMGSLIQDMDDDRIDDDSTDAEVVIDVLPMNTFLEEEEGPSEEANTISPFEPSPQSEHDWECPRCKMLNAAEINRCCMCDVGRDDNPGLPLALALEQIAIQADFGQHNRPKSIIKRSFWDTGRQFADALRLFGRILRQNEVRTFVEPMENGSCLIKHALCFRQIVEALSGDGRLPPECRLTSWNMWRGMDLLQAIDLVFLNHLAKHGKEKTKQRSTVNRLRRVLWEGINDIITTNIGLDVEKRRQCTPTRRGETSGFVVQK